MRRDLDPINLPPPAPDYGGNVPEGDPRDLREEVGNQPIDNLDLGTDPEHLGGPEGGKVDDEPGRPAIEERGPVQEAPGADDADLAKRQKLAKSTDPTGDNPAETIDPNAEQPRGW